MLKRIAQWCSDKRGIAAVEFALIVPILLFLFFATVEVTSALDCRSRINNAVSTAADLTAQASQVSTSDLSNVVAAIGAILYPYTAAPYSSGAAHIVISSIVDNNITDHGKVVWSYASNATPLAVNAPVSLPTGLIAKGSGQSVILASITYDYASPTTNFVIGTIAMNGQFYARPRRSTTVSCGNC